MRAHARSEWRLITLCQMSTYDVLNMQPLIAMILCFVENMHIRSYIFCDNLSFVLASLRQYTPFVNLKQCKAKILIISVIQRVCICIVYECIAACWVSMHWLQIKACSTISEMTMTTMLVSCCAGNTSWSSCCVTSLRASSVRHCWTSSTPGGYVDPCLRHTVLRNLVAIIAAISCSTGGGGGWEHPAT